MGLVLIYAGLVIVIAGHVMFLVAAQRVSRGWFLSCLFLPFVALFFLLLHFPRAWKALVVQCAGIMVATVGMRLAERAA